MTPTIDIEFGFRMDTREVGAFVTIGERKFYLQGPIAGPSVPVGPWCSRAIEFLICQGVIPETERTDRLACVRAVYVEAGFAWGIDDNGNREVQKVARERQSN